MEKGKFLGFQEKKKNLGFRNQTPVKISDAWINEKKYISTSNEICIV